MIITAGFDTAQADTIQQKTGIPVLILNTAATAALDLRQIKEVLGLLGQEDKIKQIDYAVEGADVTVTRTVTRNGQTIIKDTVRTHYVPWPDQFEYGPGTEIPTPEPKD